MVVSEAICEAKDLITTPPSECKLGEDATANVYRILIGVGVGVGVGVWVGVVFSVGFCHSEKKENSAKAKNIIKKIFNFYLNNYF